MIAAALPTAAVGLIVQSGESLASINEYRTVVVETGVVTVTAGMISATARSHPGRIEELQLMHQPQPRESNL
jgi:hypothetical protein